MALVDGWGFGGDCVFILAIALALAMAALCFEACALPAAQPRPTHHQSGQPATAFTRPMSWPLRQLLWAFKRGRHDFRHLGGTNLSDAEMQAHFMMSLKRWIDCCSAVLVEPVRFGPVTTKTEVKWSDQPSISNTFAELTKFTN